jgi:hypothetical protein
MCCEWRKEGLNHAKALEIAAVQRARHASQAAQVHRSDRNRIAAPHRRVRPQPRASAWLKSDRLLDEAPKHIQEAHKYFIDVRSKHVAHSFNEFEENDVTVTLREDGTS